MYFWNEEGKRVSYPLSEPYANGTQGTVYKLPDHTCLKVISDFTYFDPEILKLIKRLDLRNYYRILEVLYNRKRKVIAHKTMFYEAEDIDILCTPIGYTLTSLRGLYESHITLTEHMVRSDDLGTHNVILTSSGVVAIDTDFYCFCDYEKETLRMENVATLKLLFEGLFIEALDAYHKDIAADAIYEAINSTFRIDTLDDLEQTCKELERYTYPIDYIRCKSRR